MAIAYYLLKVTACSALLYAGYFFVLRNKTHHQFNRWYLLAAVLLSALAPLVQIDYIIHEAAQPGNIPTLLMAVSNDSAFTEDMQAAGTRPILTAAAVVAFIYATVSVWLLLRFVYALLKLYRMYHAGTAYKISNTTIIECQSKAAPFSFLGCIFWHPAINIHSPEGSNILKHELAHIKGWHSADKIFIQVLLIFYWCNPVYWMIRKELGQIHEFIADREAVAQGDKNALAAMLLQVIFPVQAPALIHPFFTSSIKRRIAMISKHKTTGIAARLLILPAALLLATAFSVQPKKIKIANPGKAITVVLDAGHGGKDYGAASSDGKHLEKDICLSIVQKTIALNKAGLIKIIPVRSSDVYMSPKEKADFANNLRPDVFVSVHLDAEPDNKNASGAGIFIARNEFDNAEKSRPLASSMINEFSLNYPLQVLPNPQQRKMGIWVLQAANCPAVLIEAGYLSNSKDLEFLTSEKGKETVALNILQAIEKYAAALQ